MKGASIAACLFSFLALANGATIPQELHKRDWITATVNGVAVSWQTGAAAAATGAPAASSGEGKTLTRTHTVTVKSQNHKRNVVPASATFDGKVVVWTMTVPGAQNVAAAPATSAAAPATSAAAASSAPAAASSNAPVSKAVSSSGGNNDIGGDLSAFLDPLNAFEDGKVKCSDFPSGQGVIKVPWANLDGWTTIYLASNGGATTCVEGALCSYACQAGMSKTQWPKDQPASGESRGGLSCKNGFLYRTNTDEKYLCKWGAKTSNAVSKLNQVISLCRTDYPGSENMNIPTRLSANGQEPMSVVDEDTYYQWQGKPTSTQYYVNNAGTDVDKGCLWGTDGGGVGNWAPVTLGSGEKGGKTYLSIAKNPNNPSKPNFNVKIQGGSGFKGTSGDCKYENGVITGGTDTGCTFTVDSGTADFVFY